MNQRRRPERRELALLIAPIAALSVAALIGAALTPTLAPTHPLSLLFLDARNRTLVLVATRVDLAPFLAVAVLRRLASDPLYYVLGRRYGERAVKWIERQFGGGVIKATEVVFRRASYPMVFLFPGALVCALAGQTGMHPVVFAILNMGGTVAVVLTLRVFGTTVLADPVEAVLGFFNDHRVETTAVSVGLVLLYLLMQKVSGRIDTPSIDELEAELEAELEGEDASVDDSEVEESVEADGHARSGADGLDREDDPRQER